MAKKTILVTGATDGIGRQAAIDLAATGARVLVHGRDPERLRSTAEEIASKTGNRDLGLYRADLSSQAQVRAMAAQVLAEEKRLDVLINNAGTFYPKRTVTEDGVEATFAVNYLAPFLLTNLLLDLLKRSTPARVVIVSSGTHLNGELDWNNLQGERHYDGWQAYARSKLCEVLFTFELAERLQETGVSANCLTPGVIGTKLLRAGWGGAGGGRPEAGAQKLTYLALSPEVEGVSGRYFMGNSPSYHSPLADDRQARRRLWELSLRLTGLAEAKQPAA